MSNYQGRYKALCDKEVVLINDYFIVDFDTNVYMKYSDIEKFKQESINSLYLESKDAMETLVFEGKLQREAFEKSLKNRL